MHNNKPEAKTEFPGEDDVKCLIERRFKQFESRLAKYYIAGIKFDFSEEDSDCDGDDQMQESPDYVKNLEEERPMNQVVWTDNANADAIAEEQERSQRRNASR
jgi:hypothetical protein